MREMKKTGKLTESQSCVLTAMGFPWLDFQDGFQYYCVCMGSKKFDEVSDQWSNHVRSDHRDGKLSQMQISMLKSIGFDFEGIDIRTVVLRDNSSLNSEEKTEEG